MGKSLKTNSSVWSKVFRAIIQKLRTDPDVRRVIGTNLRVWDGSPGDKTPFVPSEGRPVVRLTPQPRNVDWFSEDAQYGTLYVKVEIAVQSLDIDDVIDLYDVLVHTLNPGLNNMAFSQSLIALGAETGEITFSDPSMDPKPDAQPEGQFFAEGGFWLKVIRSIST